jgi:hypothetical protein
VKLEGDIYDKINVEIRKIVDHEKRRQKVYALFYKKLSS